MIDEPFRWIEAINNRREYIEHELAPGSPTIGLSIPEGILLLTFGRDRRKIFEIYDRIAMGGIGHPGDLERLRMTAIEFASTEGFTRSAADVSLRRMVTYSFSPALKQAFEQIYGAPYLARLLFAELGATEDEDLLIRLDYDGSMVASSMVPSKRRQNFGAISGSKRSLDQVESFLRQAKVSDLQSALRVAIHAWALGIYMVDEDHQAPPDDSVLHGFLKSRLETYTLEAGFLDRSLVQSRACYREVSEGDLNLALQPFQKA